MIAASDPSAPRRGARGPPCCGDVGRDVARRSRLVEHHKPEILGIGAVLERRGRIWRTDSAVNKIFMRVEEAPIDVRAVSQRGLELARRITEALREFAR